MFMGLAAMGGADGCCWGMSWHVEVAAGPRCLRIDAVVKEQRRGGQVAGSGSARSRVNAVTRASAHGQVRSMRRTVRRPLRVMRAGTCSSW